MTAGPTREPLDPVRFLSNTSSGRQGVAIAAEAVARGWHVDFVHGPLEMPPPKGVILHPVQTAADMLRVCRGLHEASDVVIGAAAVCDYRPERALPHKQKRGGGAWETRLLPTEDILADLGARKAQRVHVGFALETDNLLRNARRKLLTKHLDYLVANPATAMGAAGSHYHLLSTDGSTRDLGFLSKEDLARILCDAIEDAARCRSGDCGKCR